MRHTSTPPQWNTPTPVVGTGTLVVHPVGLGRLPDKRRDSRTSGERVEVSGRVVEDLRGEQKGRPLPSGPSSGKTHPRRPPGDTRRRTEVPDWWGTYVSKVPVPDMRLPSPSRGGSGTTADHWNRRDRWTGLRNLKGSTGRSPETTPAPDLADHGEVTTWDA